MYVLLIDKIKQVPRLGKLSTVEHGDSKAFNSKLHGDSKQSADYQYTIWY